MATRAQPDAPSTGPAISPPPYWKPIASKWIYKEWVGALEMGLGRDSKAPPGTVERLAEHLAAQGHRALERMKIKNYLTY